MESAQEKFESITGYLDSAELAAQCVNLAEEEERAYKEKCRVEREIKEREAEQRRLEYEEAEKFRRKVLRRIGIVVCPILVVALLVGIILSRPNAVDMSDRIAEINLADMDLEMAQKIFSLKDEMKTMNPLSRLMVKGKTKLRESYQSALDFIGNEETKDDPSRNITLEDLVGVWKSEKQGIHEYYVDKDVSGEENYRLVEKWTRYDDITMFDNLELLGYDYSEKAMMGECSDYNFKVSYDENNQLSIFFYNLKEDDTYRFVKIE